MQTVQKEVNVRNTREQEAPASAEWQRVYEKVHDLPGKTQIETEILIGENLTQKEISGLLHALCKSILQRTGFEHRAHPSHVVIYAFTSVERVSSKQWTAMLTKVPSTQAEIQYMPLETSPLPSTRFGLSLSQRKQLFREMTLCDDRALREAEGKYPPLSYGSKYVTYYEAQLEKYLDALAKKHGITPDQLDEIGVEGLAYDWAMPPREAR